MAYLLFSLCVVFTGLCMYYVKYRRSLIKNNNVKYVESIKNIENIENIENINHALYCGFEIHITIGPPDKFDKLLKFVELLNLVKKYEKLTDMKIVYVVPNVKK